MRKSIFFIVPLMLLGSDPVPAFTPSENGNGVRWVSASAESWSGSAQRGTDNSLLHLAGAFDESVDTTNGNGVTAFIGLLDPISGPTTGETPTPTMGEMPTPTMDGGPTPTRTPGGPCVPAVADSDFDLNGDGDIDAIDLLLLMEELADGMAPLIYDFNCDGEADDLDLIEFSQKWGIEIPPGR